MCPKGIEATFYALVLAVINAGYLISYWLGGLLAYEFDITGDVGSFSKLPLLISIAALVPILTLFMLLMLPKETLNIHRQSSVLIDNDENTQLTDNDDEG